MTILGPCPCRGCGSRVWVVRRLIAYLCSSHGRLCSSRSMALTVVEADGTTHMCLASVAEA